MWTAGKAADALLSVCQRCVARFRASGPLDTSATSRPTLAPMGWQACRQRSDGLLYSRTPNAAVDAQAYWPGSRDLAVAAGGPSCRPVAPLPAHAARGRGISRDFTCSKRLTSPPEFTPRMAGAAKEKDFSKAVRTLSRSDHAVDQIRHKTEVHT